MACKATRALTFDMRCSIGGMNQIPPTAVVTFVDAMLDRALIDYPYVDEWEIAVSPEQEACIPIHSDKLVRTVNGRLGYYSGHVYRDCMVEDIFDKSWLVRVLGWSEDEPALWGDLRTGVVSTEPPAEAFRPISD